MTVSYIEQYHGRSQPRLQFFRIIESRLLLLLTHHRDFCPFLYKNKRSLAFFSARVERRFSRNIFYVFLLCFACTVLDFPKGGNGVELKLGTCFTVKTVQP